MLINSTFNLITVISWQSVLLVEETGVSGIAKGYGILMDVTSDARTAYYPEAL
jgi:hypothetical protein